MPGCNSYVNALGFWAIFDIGLVKNVGTVSATAGHPQSNQPAANLERWKQAQIFQSEGSSVVVTPMHLQFWHCFWCCLPPAPRMAHFDMNGVPAWVWPRIHQSCLDLLHRERFACSVMK